MTKPKAKNSLVPSKYGLYRSIPITKDLKNNF
jgi:hypothetical protein